MDEDIGDRVDSRVNSFLCQYMSTFRGRKDLRLMREIINMSTII